MKRNSQAIDYRALMENALVQLESLQSKLNALEGEKKEPIAIIGMGCRFPGGVDSPASFWQLLSEAIDSINEVPKDRWNIDEYYDPERENPGKICTRYGGFLEQVDQFDAQFFRISAREAQSLDPQQRILLEVSWEALEHACQVPEKLFNSLTGVFMGISNQDYFHKLLTNQRPNAYFGTGNAFSAAAGRLSYVLGLTGPSLAVETACSSSLVAVHLACQSLRQRECNQALAGGVNLLLSPETSMIFSQARMLSPDGRCKTFDAKADGYARGEGCGVIVLKRLSEAVKDGDNVLAVIRGTAINQDGASGGLTVPNGPSQETVIRRALENAGVAPAQVSYIEAHGTGTSLGDPIEVEALGEVFSENHSSEQPLMIGSVKTNIGHLESAAGIAGLIKVVLQLQHQEIVPHLHFNNPNPLINWENLRVKVPTEATRWQGQDQPRIAGVSSFGFSGTNAHVILEEAPVSVKSKNSQDKEKNIIERPWHLLTLSAKTDLALQELASRYVNYLDTNPEVALSDICFTANTKRTHFEHRLAVVTQSLEQLRSQLLVFSQGEEYVGLYSGTVKFDKQPKIAFLFTGQGSQYVGMGRQLYETEPTFKASLDRCAEILDSYLDESLLDILYPSEGQDSLIDETAYTQPAIFALEYSLCQLWQSWGIETSVVMGHSIGEYVAACVAGIFSLEDGLKLIAHRGRLMQSLPDNGKMVSVLADETTVKEAIKNEEFRIKKEEIGTPNFETSLAIAAYNGPNSIVISGKDEQVDVVKTLLENQGIKVKELNVSHAFHSPLMEPILAEFEDIAESVSYSAPKITLISNVTGEKARAEVATPQYWVNHIRQPVQFAQSMKTIEREQASILLEIGSKPILLGMGRLCIADEDKLWLPSLRAGQSDWQQLLVSLGQLYIQGGKIYWEKLEQGYFYNKLPLPTYPFQREKYWVESLEITEKRADTFEKMKTPIMDLLNQGKTEDLVQKLEQVGHFTLAQKELLPQLLEILSAQHQQQLALAKISDWLYQVKWQQLSESQPKIIAQPSHWLIFADQTGIGTALAEKLVEQGYQCSLVYRGESYQNRAEGIYEVNPSQPEDFHQLYQQVVDSSSELSLTKVIHLWSLDHPATAELTRETLAESQITGCGSVLHLVQALGKQTNSVSPQLWLITRGSQPVLSEQKDLAVPQCPLWGMGRVISLEHPQMWGGMIDLDLQPTDEEVDLLAQRIENNQSEDHLAMRGKETYVARLVKQQPLKPQPLLSLSSDATYLITGGLGALGMHVAEWMVTKGARNLVLISRRQPSPNKLAAISNLEQQGARVVVAQGDVSKMEEVLNIFEQINNDLPPLKGIVHAAGIGAFQPMQEMELTQLEEVMAAKVAGGWILHQLSKDKKWDFFVTFSSIAAVWGSGGQAHYGASNHFLDGLTYYRRARGLPSLSINWGPWLGGGMAGEQELKELRKRGLEPLSPKQGIGALELLWTSGNSQTTVANVNWGLFKQLYEMGGRKLLLEKIEIESEEEIKPTETKRNEFRERLESASESEGYDLLRTQIQTEVAKVIGLSENQLPSFEEGFFDLGMDSLMTVELLNRMSQWLGVKLPSTLTFDFSNIEQLSQYISSQVLHLSTGEDAQQPKQTKPSETKLLSEPIAIIGIGCSFPGGATSPEKFWELLRGGISAREEIPAQRWDINSYYDPNRETPGKMVTRHGHFIEAVEQFDPGFFGISPREATAIDPQHRLLLEVSWQALERAGQKVERLSGATVGVFVGNDGHDYEQLIQKHLQQEPNSPLALYFGTGNAISCAAGRLAYTFGFTGPTATIDTACSSSLVAIHQACNSLRLGECQMAIAGGVKLHLTPGSYIFTSQAGMLSPDGICKTFDVSADGYGRGEGCGMVVLKTLTKAQADGDPILALIRGSAMNQDGPSSGLTVPNGQSQQKVIRQALNRARVKPGEISYLEAHGTGTSLGDPIEVNSAAEVLGQERSPEKSLWIGTVKTNIGHLESAAGVSGLIKVVLSMQHKQLPPHLHLHEPNPKIDWQPWLRVPETLTPWETSQKRLAGVSSFGFTGTNAHVILEESPTQVKKQKLKVKDLKWEERPYQILTLSAKGEEALQELAQSYEEFIENNSTVELTDICFTANTGRTHFNHRLGVIASNKEELKAKLSQFKVGEEVAGLFSGQISGSTSAPKVAFLFTGQGSQYINMGKELYETQPVFREALDQCNQILTSYLEQPLLSVIYAPEGESSPIDETAYTQPALFALEYALAQMWQSWGIKPSVVMGHSVGEYVAACIAGVFSLEDGLKLIAHRGRLMQSLPHNGKMVSVLANEATVSQAIEPYQGRVVIATYNGPESIVISGEKEGVEKVKVTLEAQGVKTKELKVSHAFHSPLMEPILTEFGEIAESVSYSTPTIPLISNVTGEENKDEIANGQYWVNHIRQPVKFAQGMATLGQGTAKVFLEIGPKPILLGMGRLCIADGEQLWLPSLRVGQSDWQQLLSSVAQLYVQGGKIDWQKLEQGYAHQKVILPTYPFQRQKYWVENSTQYSRHGLNQKIYPLLGSKLELASSNQIIYHQEINLINRPWIGDHRVYDTAVIPGVSHIALTFAAVGTPAAIEEVNFIQPLFLVDDKATRETQLLIHGDDDTETKQKVKVFSRDTTARGQWQQHAEMTLLKNPPSLPALKVDLKSLYQQLETIDSDLLKEIYAKVSLVYGPMLEAVSQAWIGAEKSLLQIEVPEALESQLAGEPIHPVLLDACTRLYPQASETMVEEEGVFWAPWKVQEVTLSRPTPRLFYAYVDKTPQLNEQLQTRAYDIYLLDEMGESFGLMNGFTIRRAPREAFLRSLQISYDDWFYQIQWQPQSISPDNKSIDLSKSGSWLIFSPSTGGIGKNLAESLEQQGQHCILVKPAENYQQWDSQNYQVNPLKQNEFTRLLEESLAEQPPLRGIVHLWSLEESLTPLTSVEVLQKSQELSCGSVLHLVQALGKNQKRENPPLWLITQGSQSVESDSEPVVQFTQGSLWGLARVITQEYIDIKCRCLDLDAIIKDNQAASILLEELLSPSDENQIAYRQEVRHVARWARSQKALTSLEGQEKKVEIEPKANYLITGGLGALGLKVAEWMVTEGARHLVLSGRREPSVKAQEKIEELEKMGAEVSVIRGDISKQEDVAKIIEKIKVGETPLKGIIHGAGVLDDGMLQQMSWERFEKVMKPKVGGAWYLHQLSQDLDLDFFVCFSSVASLLGNAGQGNYAAANGFMDALAHYRRGRGLPGLSINWGPWSEGGMAASLGSEHKSLMKSKGITPIAPEKGMQVLGELLSVKTAQVAVLPINWTQFWRQIPSGKKMPFLEIFASSKLSQESVKRDDFIQQLQGASFSERQSRLMSYIKKEVARVLGLTHSQIDEESSLIGLGLDSLMAVELRNKVNKEISIDIPFSVLMQDATVQIITNYLNNQFNPQDNIIEGEL